MGCTFTHGAAGTWSAGNYRALILAAYEGVVGWHSIESNGSAEALSVDGTQVSLPISLTDCAAIVFQTTPVNNDLSVFTDSVLFNCSGTATTSSNIGSNLGKILFFQDDFEIEYEATSSSYTVQYSSGSPFGASGGDFYDGQDTEGPFLGNLVANSSGTFTISSGWMYVAVTAGTGRDPGTTSGGVSIYSADEYGFLYQVTGNGSVTGAWADPCIIEGTLITLADGTKKKIEDITYDDNILVWNFYEGKFDSSKPVWIKKKQVSNRYNLLTFEDGTTLGLVGSNGYHRIYNDQAGAFTHTGTPDTPNGTLTFNESGHKIKLIRQELKEEFVNHYNVITDKHYNLFANGILTSCRLSNKFAIDNMKYIGEQLISDEEESEYFRNLEILKR